MKTLKSGLIISAIALLFIACAQNPSVNTTGNGNGNGNNTTINAPPADTLAEGRKLYNQNCAACHRANGTGGKIDIEGKTLDPDDLTSEKIAKFPDDKIYGYIVNGVPDEGMPSFKDKLKEAQIREVVRFIRADLQKKGQ
jgi:mono/diheme cytochrome c family protein